MGPCGRGEFSETALDQDEALGDLALINWDRLRPLPYLQALLRAASKGQGGAALGASLVQRWEGALGAWEAIAPPAPREAIRTLPWGALITSLIPDPLLNFQSIPPGFKWRPANANQFRFIDKLFEDEARLLALWQQCGVALPAGLTVAQSELSGLLVPLRKGLASRLRSSGSDPQMLSDAALVSLFSEDGFPLASWPQAQADWERRELSRALPAGWGAKERPWL